MSTGAGALTEYVVEKYRGKDPKFDVAGVVESTVYNLAWSNLLFKVFGPLGKKIAEKRKIFGYH